MGTMEMKRKIQKLITTLVVLLASILPFSAIAGDPAAGKEKAALCLTCHKAGNEVVGAATPILAGQYEDYLIAATKSYRSGERNNPIMGSLVVGLSDKDIEDIAAYYSSLESKIFTPKN